MIDLEKGKDVFCYDFKSKYNMYVYCARDTCIYVCVYICMYEISKYEISLYVLVHMFHCLINYRSKNWPNREASLLKIFPNLLFVINLGLMCTDVCVGERERERIESWQRNLQTNHKLAKNQYFKMKTLKSNFFCVHDKYENTNNNR